MLTGDRQQRLAGLYPWLKSYWPCLLVLLAFLGFISKSLYQYPIALMALFGLYHVIREPRQLWQDKSLRYFTVCFLCLWLPLLVSYIDAYNPERSARTVFPYLRFLFAGIFMVKALGKDQQRLKLVGYGLAFLVSFWTIDASIQFFLGRDLFGYPAIDRHMTGMFYPELHLPHVCSALSPFLFLYIYQRQDKTWWPWLLLLPLFFVILVAGRRSTWLMLALSSAGFLVYAFLLSQNRRRLLRLGLLFSVLIGTLIAGTVAFHEPTNKRIQKTLGLFSQDYEEVNAATARRLPLWETAVTIFKDNPVNGIGPRGFRYAYPEYASADNYWSTQTHPHLLLLEVLVETGLIGFVGYLLMVFLLIRLFLADGHRELLSPYLLCVVVSLFPVNAHMALYGSLWSSMSWLLLSLYLASYRSLSLAKA